MSPGRKTFVSCCAAMAVFCGQRIENRQASRRDYLAAIQRGGIPELCNKARRFGKHFQSFEHQLVRNHPDRFTKRTVKPRFPVILFFLAVKAPVDSHFISIMIPAEQLWQTPPGV